MPEERGLASASSLGQPQPRPRDSRCRRPHEEGAQTRSGNGMVPSTRTLVAHEPRRCPGSHGPAAVPLAPAWAEGHLAKASALGSLFYKWQASNHFPVQIMEFAFIQSPRVKGSGASPTPTLETFSEVTSNRPHHTNRPKAPRSLGVRVCSRQAGASS